MGLLIALVAIIMVFAIMLIPKMSFFHFSIMCAPFLVTGNGSFTEWIEKKVRSDKNLRIRHLKQGSEDLYLFMRGVWFVPFPANMVQKIQVLYPGKRIEVDRNVCIALLVLSEVSQVFVSTTFVSGNCDMFLFRQPKQKLPLVDSANGKVRNYVCTLSGRRYAIIQVIFSNAERCEIWFDYQPS